MRVGGSNNRTLTWSGPVTATGTSSINADGGTTGVVLGGSLEISGGTFSSICSGVANTISGPISGTTGTLRVSSGTLTLSAANSYAGTTTVNAGTLALGANSALPATPVIIGNGTLDAATFTDTVGMLDVTSTAAKINLGTGGSLAFANSGISSGIDWNGGLLSITGNFVPGVSLRFGNSSSGLTSTQLALISAPGFTSFALTPTGFLTDPGFRQRPKRRSRQL